jgi:hypothetical protein
MLPPRTAATRAAPSAPPPPAPSRRIEPTPGPPVYEEPPPVSYAPEAPARGGLGAGQIVLLLVLAAVVAGLIAFAIGNSQGGSSAPNITQIDGKTTDGIIDQMTRLVDDNTR